MTTKTAEKGSAELTALDHAGINFYATLFAELGTEETPLQESADEIYKMLVECLKDPEYRLLARFMGAATLERNVWGDRRTGQDDPPVDGFLGKAIDQVIEQLTPLVAARNQRFLDFVEAEDW